MDTKSKSLSLSEEVRKRQGHHPLTKNIYPTDIGIYNNKKGQIYRQNGIDTHLLIICIGGQGFIKSPKINSKVTPNRFLLLPANREHSYGSSPGHTWSIYWVHFGGARAEDYFNHIDKDIFLSSISEMSLNRTLTVFRELFDVLNQGFWINNLIMASQLLGNVLGQVFFSSDLITTAQYSRSAVEKAVDFMSDNLTSSLSLSDIASDAGLSKTHFSYLFKKDTGFTPIDYYNNLKIRRACHYLDSSPLRIGEISEKIGIENQHYFSRLFAKIMGMSPRDYRRMQSWNKQ